MSYATLNEEWRDIPGYEGYYEVSSLGRVRSLARTKRHWMGGQCSHAGRILNTGNDQYPRVSLHRNGKSSRRMVHVLVAELFVPGNRPGMNVNHKDGNKHNCQAVNLEWVTPKENTVHAWATGLCTPNAGESHGCAKLTNADVVAIRSMRSNGATLNTISHLYGVTETTVSYICNRKTWKHIKEPICA